MSENIIKTSDVEIGLQIARLYSTKKVSPDKSLEEQCKSIMETIVCYLLIAENY